MSTHQLTPTTSLKAQQATLPFTTPPGVPSDTTVPVAEKVDQNDVPDSKFHNTNGGTRNPHSLKQRYTISLGLAFIVMAITSEVISHHRGFNIPLDNSELSSAIQVFKSYGPSTIFELLFLLFAPSYNAIKLLHYYAKIDDEDTSVNHSSWHLLSAGPFPVFLDGLKKHHWTIAMLSFIGLSQVVFSPLASSYFTIIPEPHRANVSVTVSGRVGIGISNNSAGLYTPFISAAGSLDAMLYGGVPSPYILPLNDTTMWMVPGFTLADPKGSAQVGNVSTDLSAVMVQARCAPANSTVLNITTIEGTPYYVIEGTLSNGCKTTSYSPKDSVGTWFAWATSSAPFECVNDINPSETTPAQGYFYNPATFTFFKNDSMHSMVLCYSVLVEHTVSVSFNLDPEHNKLSNLSSRKVVGSLGYGLNGLTFPNASFSTSVTRIGDSIRTTMSGAIARYAGHQGVPGAEIDTSLQDKVLSDPNLVTNKAQRAYLLYNVLVSKSAYVVGPTFTQEAIYDTPALRLIANKHVSHVLTALCIITGFMIIVLFRDRPGTPPRTAPTA